MKRLAIMNEKGGVGKSMVACQFAFYVALKRGLRVLVLDFDQQGNTTNTLTHSGKCCVASVSTGKLLVNAEIPSAEDLDAPFVLMPADNYLVQLERTGVTNHQTFILNLNNALEMLDDQFDLCIIDTNPSPDVRATAAMANATHVLAPLELKQESLDGVFELLNKVRGVQESLNPELQLLGLLPNLVEKKPYQIAGLNALLTGAGKFLFMLPSGKPAAIPNAAAIAEAQGDGRPLWEGPRTKVDRVSGICRQVWEAMADQMGLENRADQQLQEKA